MAASTATAEALELDPLSATAHLNRARQLRMLGEFGESRDHALRVLELSARRIQRAAAEVELGIGYWSDGMLSYAESHARKALAEVPGFAPAEELLRTLSESSAVE